MPGTRKPPSQLSQENIAHNKGVFARRDLEPKATGKVGRPPAYLDKNEKKLWKELVRDSPSKLGTADKFLIEMTVHLLTKLRARTLESQERSQLHLFMKSLGYIPPTREAVPEKKPTTPDEWDSLDG
jgi:hypothetical protein